MVSRTKNLILGTATPIQTEVRELWGLMRILNSGVDFALGRYSAWVDWRKALPLVKGDYIPASEKEAWEWMRNPLPPGNDDIRKVPYWKSVNTTAFSGLILWNSLWGEFISIPKEVIGMETACEDKS